VAVETSMEDEEEVPVRDLDDEGADYQQRRLAKPFFPTLAQRLLL